MSSLPETEAANTTAQHAQRDIARGVAAAASAYVFWGVIPIFWKQLAHVTTSEILVFRVLGTVVFSAALVGAWGQGGAILTALKQRAVLIRLAISAVLIAGNWWLFIWAVNAGHILETSLGYFINPLMSIALGVALLGERLNARQSAAVGIAAVGVVHHIWALGVAPWVALSLAVSFALYGLVRKHVVVSAIVGLLIETTIVAPIALAYGYWLWDRGHLQFVATDGATQFLLSLAGPATAVPLILFAFAVRRVRLSTVGFLQFIAPTLTMLTAIFHYGEPFTHDHLITFGLIWFALGLASFDLIRRDYSAA